MRIAVAVALCALAGAIGDRMKASPDALGFVAIAVLGAGAWRRLRR